jgi:hypothetical protein
MVRVSPEQLPDSIRFPVRETEGAVERQNFKRICGDLRQVIQSNASGGGISRERAALRFTRCLL